MQLTTRVDPEPLGLWSRHAIRLIVVLLSGSWPRHLVNFICSTATTGVVGAVSFGAAAAGAGAFGGEALADAAGAFGGVGGAEAGAPPIAGGLEGDSALGLLTATLAVATVFTAVVALAAVLVAPLEGVVEERRLSESDAAAGAPAWCMGDSL